MPREIRVTRPALWPSRGLRAALIVAGIVTSTTATAGEPVEGRLEAALRVPVVQDLDLMVGSEIRVQNGFQRVLPEVKFAWTAAPWLRADLGFRTGADRLNEGGFRSLHRLFIDGRVDQAVGRVVELGYRMRMQQEWSRGETESEWRHRLSADVIALEVLEPGISWEVFAPFAKDQPIELTRWRFEVSLALDFGAHDITPYWFLQQRFHRTAPDPEHVIGLSYRYSL